MRPVADEIVAQMNREDMKAILLGENCLSEVERMFSPESVLRPWTSFVDVRGYNRTVGQLAYTLGAIDAICELAPGLGIRGLFYTIDMARDNGATPDNLLLAIKEANTRLPIVIWGQQTGGSWTSMLNGPQRFVARMLQSLDRSPEDISMFNMSNDATFTPDELKLFEERLVRQQGLLYTARFDRGRELEASAKDFLDIVTAIRTGQQVALNRDLVGVARNTAAFWPIRLLEMFGGFDPWANFFGGMEDHHLVLLAMLAGGESEMMVNRALDNLITFTDRAWDSMSEESRDAKITRELTALGHIIRLLRYQAKCQSYALPAFYQDFN